jgi:hypothetical protein
MSTLVARDREICARILEHLLGRIERTLAIEAPFSHLYLENVFPDEVYEELLASLPDPGSYSRAHERYGKADGDSVRWMYHLTPERINDLPDETQEFWRGLAAALTAAQLKEAMYSKLAVDLAFRYNVPFDEVSRLPGYSRPTLYRETDGFEIPPHPDTRKKIVTMQLYCPRDGSQLDLGTALYRRKLLGWPLGGWRNRFDKVKQFAFRPNSGYAFVVNNTLTHKSWHGREQLPVGAGVRNTLLNTFYDQQRQEYTGYLQEPI